MTTQFLTFVTLHAVQASRTRAITGHMITGGLFRTRTCLGTIQAIEPFRAFLKKVRSKQENTVRSIRNSTQIAVTNMTITLTLRFVCFDNTSSEVTVYNTSNN